MRIRTSNLFSSWQRAKAPYLTSAMGTRYFYLVEEYFSHLDIINHPYCDATWVNKSPLYLEGAKRKKRVPQPRIELGISGSQPDEMTIFLLWQNKRETPLGIEPRNNSSVDCRNSTMRRSPFCDFKGGEVIQRFELWSTGSKPVILTTIRYHQKFGVCRLG